MVLFMLSFLDVFSLLFPDQSSPDWKPCQRAVGRAHWCKNPLDRDVSIMGKWKKRRWQPKRRRRVQYVMNIHSGCFLSSIYSRSKQHEEADPDTSTDMCFSVCVYVCVSAYTVDILTCLMKS